MARGGGTPLTVLAKTASMYDNNYAVKKRIGVPRDAYRLGVDETGTEHWHSLSQGRIWLVDATPEGFDVDMRELEDRPVSVWVAYVRAERGGWVQREPVEQRDGFGGLVTDFRQEVA